jgi:hypothetical protein
VDVTSDGTITVLFTHGVQNPIINAIEVVDLGAAPVLPTPQQWLAHRSFDGVTAGARSQQASSVDWARARGIFYANGSVYYGWDDGKMYRRTFNGTSFGSAKVVSTNGLSPTYFPITSVSGMFLTDGRLYYTVRGDDRLFYRYFSLESKIVGAVTFVASGPGDGFSWGTVRGLTLADGDIYAARADGTLWRVGWTPGLVNGVPTPGSATLVDSDPAQAWPTLGMFVRN